MKGRLSSCLCWYSTLVVRATAVPEAVGQQVPECREQGRSNQRFEERYPEEDRITRNDEDHHIGDDPYPHQRGNDRPNDAEREPPAYNELCNKADNGRDEQVHELTLIESQMNSTYVDRDEWKLTQECEHSILLLLSVYACFGRIGIQFRYTQPVLLFYTPYLLVSFQEARRTSKNMHPIQNDEFVSIPRSQRGEEGFNRSQERIQFEWFHEGDELALSKLLLWYIAIRCDQDHGDRR
jgi:hypothetical protein